MKLEEQDADAPARTVPIKKPSEFSLVFLVMILLVILVSLYRIWLGNDQPVYKISVVVSDSSSARWASFKSGLQQAAKDNHVKLNYVYTDYISDLNTEMQIINREISNGANGIITEFCTSNGTQEVVREITGRVPVVFVNGEVDADAGAGGTFGVVGPDNYQIGRAIGNELVIQYRDALRGKKIGLLTGNQMTRSMQERLRGFQDAVESKHPDLLWSLSDRRNMALSIRNKNTMQSAEILVGLDNKALEDAVDFTVDAGWDQVPLYGAGCSEKLVYYIDTGRIRSMILPNDYNMGYQAMNSISVKLNNRLNSLEQETIGYSIVNQQNLFRKENQQVLFPVEQ